MARGRGQLRLDLRVAVAVRRLATVRPEVPLQVVVVQVLRTDKRRREVRVSTGDVVTCFGGVSLVIRTVALGIASNPQIYTVDTMLGISHLTSQPETVSKLLNPEDQHNRTDVFFKIRSGSNT